MSFERLAKTQSAIASRLCDELASASLPGSILFYGSPYSSRLTAAIELGLALSGEEDKYTRLDSGNLIILTNRDTLIRLRAARNLVDTKRNRRSIENLVHETGILLSSFHEIFHTGSSKDGFEDAGALSDILYELPEDLEGKDFKAWLKSYDKGLEGLLARRKKSQVFTIDQIRAVQTFLQQNEGQNKVVVLENIEDVTVGAMNSILKILEEPPKGAYLILVSRNAKRILPTILSRVRQYEFPPIPVNVQKRLLADHFSSMDGESVEGFIYSASGLDMAALDANAEDFIHQTLVRHQGLDNAALGNLCSFLEESGAWDLFLSRLVSIVEDGFVKGRISNTRADSILSLLNQSAQDAAVYAQNRRIMMERLERGLALL